MLTRIQLENFKSWRALDIELAPITLLFGTNSSGKTAILQSLLLLKQTANSFDRKQHINFGGSNRDYVDFGSWRDLVFGHDESHEVKIGLKYDLEVEGVDVIVDNNIYEVTWKKAADQVWMKDLYFGFDIGLKEIVAPYIRATKIDLEDEDYIYQAPETWELQYAGESDEIPSPENSYTLPDGLTLQFDTDTLEVGLETDVVIRSLFLYAPFRLLLNRTNYLGPLRQHPQRTYLWTGSMPNTIGPNGENTVASLVASEREGGDLPVQVSQWLSDLEIADGLSIEPIDQAKRFYEPKVKIGDTASSLLDVGFGVSQVLPVITLLFFAPEGSIILLEQPELHLHPNAQAHLADLMLHVAETRKLQLIVESHSEHLLTRLQRRIAESDHAFASPENIRMYFCDIEQGESKAQPVEIDEYGQIKNWPENFFGDRGGDLDAMMDAALAKRRRELERGG